MSMVSKQNAIIGRINGRLKISGPHAVPGYQPIVGPIPEGYETISFGLGCFWGAEKVFWRDQYKEFVYTTAVGYQGGYTPNPTYEEVCSAQTGHAEVVLVVYDPVENALQHLLKAFWEVHDPTTENRQGNDCGT